VSSKGDLFPFGKAGVVGRAGGSAANGKGGQGGASPHTPWALPEPRERIAEDAHAIVVLQENIPETTVASFRGYTRKFVTEIRAARRGRFC